MAVKWVFSFWLVCFVGRVRLGQADCLPDAVPAWQRKLLSVDGVRMSVGIWQLGWDSPAIFCNVAKILIEEVLGYNATITQGSGSSSAIWALAGCPSGAYCSEDTMQKPSRLHLSFEVWASSSSATATAVAEQFRDVSPINLGLVGFLGQEAPYVKASTLRRALQEGVGLDSYRFYNTTWYDTRAYFDDVASIPAWRLSQCSACPNLAESSKVEAYLRLFPQDAGGVETYKSADGTLKYRARCDDGFRWLSPACRQNVSSCIPLVSTPDGWGVVDMMQRATYFNIPMAVMCAHSWGDYTYLGSQLDTMVFWAKPDPTFLKEGMAIVQFPPNNAAEWSDGLTVSNGEYIPCNAWAATRLADVAPNIVSVAQNIDISMEGMMDLFAWENAVSGRTHYDAACNFLRTSDAWHAWIPLETECAKGKGLVNASGHFVFSRALATTCDWCGQGTFTKVLIDDVGTTRFCEKCPAGTYNDKLGATECLVCSFGAYSSEVGGSICELCPQGTWSNITMATACVDCVGVLMTTLQVGSRSASACECRIGTWRNLHGICEECGEGMLCEGGGKLMLVSGYASFSSSPSSVYVCSGHQASCPGGPPGTCASGRDNSSIVCSECLPHRYEETSGGPCFECGSNEAGLAIVAIIVVFFLLVASYHFLYKGSKFTQQRGSLLLVIMIFGQVVTLFQQLGILQQITLKWDGAFRDILAGVQVLNFNLDVFKFACVSRFSPLGRYGLRLFLVFGLVALMCLVHAVHVAVFDRCKFHGAHRHLIAAVGTLVMTFYISISTNMIAPFRCLRHPNGLMTVQDFPGVLCDLRGSEYRNMIVIGGCASLLPITFLASSAWIVLYRLPRRVRASDVDFLRTYNFLVVRFRAEAREYIIFLLVRNLLLVLVPLLPNVVAKLITFQFILLPGMLVPAWVKPWRMLEAGLLEVACLMVLLVILDLGAMQEEFVSSVDVSIVCAVLFVLLFVAIGIGFVVACVQYCLRHRMKKFKYFVCHHKGGAGCFARLIKTTLQDRSSKVFLDVDELSDLNKLFGYVAYDIESLIILLTKDVLLRKWCCGELTTARLYKVSVRAVRFPCFSFPSKMIIAEWDRIVPDLIDISAFGVGVSDVMETLEWISDHPTIQAPLPLTFIGLKTLCKEIADDSADLIRKISHHGDFDGSMCILPDHTNYEALACAFCIRSFLLTIQMANFEYPDVIPHDVKLGSACRFVIALCGAQYFENSTIATSLLDADSKGAKIIPVVFEDRFQFPNQAFYTELRDFYSVSALHLDHYFADDLLTLIEDIFKEIAIVFKPQSQVMDELVLAAKLIADKIERKMKSVSSNRVASKSSESRQLQTVAPRSSDTVTPHSKCPSLQSERAPGQTFLF